MKRHSNNLINMENRKMEIVSAYKTQREFKPSPGKEQALRLLLAESPGVPNTHNPQMPLSTKKSPPTLNKFS